MGVYVRGKCGRADDGSSEWPGPAMPARLMYGGMIAMFIPINPDLKAM